MSRYGAIDIGSNSFRMLAAEVNPHEPMKVLATDRKVVRLGRGVFRDGRIDRDAMVLGLETLRRFKSLYQDLNLLGVRAVGTAALRDASNRYEFMEPAREILGVPVEVISGLEEARLIHLGVHTMWPHPKERLLIVDIGGGSAELVLAERGHVVEAFSKPIGAVRLTELFIDSDPPSRKELARLETYVQERLMQPAARFGSRKITRMIGTSSTAAVVVCAINRIRRSRRDDADRMWATASQVEELYRELISFDLAGRRKITGIGPRRAEIVVGGVASLHNIMQSLNLRRIYYSTAGVREGIVADLAHRKVGMEQARLDEDQRRLVLSIVRQYRIGVAHVLKVAELGNILFDGLRHLHRLPVEAGRVLEAAAHLYNIGHFVNEVRHHRHSMYLVANSDMPGFTDRERVQIANLCRYHRKSLPQPHHEMFATLDEDGQRAVIQLTPLLRLAIALDQSQEQKVRGIEMHMVEGGVQLLLRSDRDTDIEQWHAQQAAKSFQTVYGTRLEIGTVPASEAEQGAA